MGRIRRISKHKKYGSSDIRSDVNRRFCPSLNIKNIVATFVKAPLDILSPYIPYKLLEYARKGNIQMELPTVGKDMEQRWYALPRLRGRKQL